MNRRTFLMLIPLTVGMLACATPASTGPGMAVTFGNGLKGKSLYFLLNKSVTSSGARFPNPGFLGPDKDPLRGGATMSAAPDGRALPEWVEFEWREAAYPEDKNQSLEEFRALPIKKARVPVRDRVPQDVVDEVMESNRQRESHKLPEKSLEVYFIWYENGVKFRWKLLKGCCETLRAGGDDIGAQ